MIQESAANYRITPARRHGQFTPAESALAASDAEAWDASSVVYTVEETNGAYSVDYTGQPVDMAVKSLSDVYGNAVAASDYRVLYFTDGNGDGEFKGTDDKAVGTNGEIAPVNPGRYFIVIVPSTWTGKITSDTTAKRFEDENVATIAQLFTVSQPTLSGVVAYEKKADSTDVSDTTFTYNGTDQASKIGFAVDGKALDPKYYTVVWSGSVTDAGSYTAHLVGQDIYAGQVVDVPVTVEKLDLSTVAVADLPAATAASAFAADTDSDNAFDNIYVGGEHFPVAANQINWSSVSSIGADSSVETGADAALSNGCRVGRYTYAVQLANTADPDNFTGVGTNVSFNVVTGVVDASSYMYDRDPLSDLTSIDLSEDDPFDPSDVYVSGYEASQYTVSVTKDGAAATDFTQPGKYTVTVRMNVPANYSFGGFATQTFTVLSGTVAADSVFVAVDGKNIPDNNATSDVATYNGKAHALATVVKAGKTTLVAGEDYTVTVKNADGDEVESIVDAGTYDITIETSAAYGASKFEFQAKIGKLALTSIKEASAYGIVYTGEPVTPSFIGLDKDGNEFALTSDDISASYFTVNYNDKGEMSKGEDVAYDKIIEADDYGANITVKATSKNFAAGAYNGVAFSVVKSIAFADVAADAWYADAVALASQTTPVKYGYMNGIPGTNLFMPEGTITRAQVAQVVYNMAGGESKTGYYPTAFSDVDPEAWYALPVLWASEAGVVTGIGDTGTFQPDTAVTREQAATMLYRYVKAQGKDVSGQADLSGYADAASVSGWAAEAMAWAVDAEVFGVGTDVLRPQDTLTRAEMAAIAVRVQPDGAIEAL